MGDKSDSLKNNILRLIIGGAICLLLILINGMGWLRPLYSWADYILEPVQYWSGQFSKTVENSFETIVEIGTLRKRNNELLIENAKLKAEISENNECETENESLRKQLEVDSSQDWDLKKSRILGIDRNGTSEHVVIDLGSEDGIEKGDVVVIGNILLGEIRDVYETSSRVRLISNQNSNVIALDQETRAKGLVHGSLDGLVMEEILENEEINIGDTVITWQDEIPEGLVIGEIREVEDNPTASTQTAYIDPGFSLEDLDFVFVITDY
jgi:rod shape-determining protein MreC